MKTKLPKYATLDEAAEILGVCHAQVARYVREGRLEAIDLGLQKLIPTAALAAFRRPPRGNPNFRRKKNGKTPQ